MVITGWNFILLSKCGVKLCNRGQSINDVISEILRHFSLCFLLSILLLQFSVLLPAVFHFLSLFLLFFFLFNLSLFCYFLFCQFSFCKVGRTKYFMQSRRSAVQKAESRQELLCYSQISEGKNLGITHVGLMQCEVK